jgi:hypothetical protein
MSFVNILIDLPNRVCGLGKLAHGYEPVPYGDTLPIAVVLRFLFFNAGDLTNDPVWIEAYSIDCRLHTPWKVFAQFPGTERFPAFGALTEHLGSRGAKLACTQPSSTLSQQYIIGNRRDVEMRSPAGHLIALHK